MAWVVRAGAAKANDLRKGYKLHSGVPGLFGFSVQYAANKTIAGLAQAGQFPHSQISYEDETVLAAALKPLGYSMRLAKSPGRGYRHTFAILYDASGNMLSDLPQHAAAALSLAFRRMPNPFPANPQGRIP